MLYTNGIISVQPPETTAVCEVENIQKSLDHPILSKIRGSVLKILRKERSRKGERKKKEENEKR